MLHDDSEARVRSGVERAGPAPRDQAIPDWDEVILHLEAASADELAESRNSHSNSAWAKLIAALVDLQRNMPATPD